MCELAHCNMKRQLLCPHVEEKVTGVPGPRRPRARPGMRPGTSHLLPAPVQSASRLLSVFSLAHHKHAVASSWPSRPLIRCQILSPGVPKCPSSSNKECLHRPGTGCHSNMFVTHMLRSKKWNAIQGFLRN